MAQPLTKSRNFRTAFDLLPERFGLCFTLSQVCVNFCLVL